MADLLQTVNLRTDIPAGWKLVGFSAVKSDGVNPYRVPANKTQVQFSTPTPRYVRFQLQLWAKQDVTATVQLDGHPLGEYHFPAGQFVNLYPSGFVGVGAHTLTVEQSCASACEIHQYHAEAKFYQPETASRSVGYNAQRWWLNAPDTALQVKGLSGIQFDGNNFYRALTGPQPATLSLPSGVRLTNLHYLPQADHGAYQLTWTADGQPLEVRSDLNTQWSPADKNANQNVPLVGRSLPHKLQVTAQCQGGGVDCFPIRLFWVDVTGVPAEAGLRSLSAPKQAFSVGLCALLCVLAAWFFRPWQGRQDSQERY